MIQLKDIGKWFGDYLLYENLSMYINEGERVALIAKNGTGKTTLLNIIAGKEYPDSGEVTFRNDIVIGYLEQEPQFDSSMNIIQAVCHNNPTVAEILSGYRNALDSGDNDKIMEYSHKMDLIQGWSIEQKAMEILTQLKLTNFNQSVLNLSGGEKKRLALASVLIDNPDVMVLDEPTNHLDLEMSSWLEDYLVDCGKTLLIVTHDRYFLDRICTDIYEIDQKQIFKYKGNYSEYLIRRGERIEQFNTEVEKARNLYRKELEWMRRMPQARGTKSKYRKDAFYETKEKAFKNMDNSKVNINTGSSRLGTKIFEAENINKSYDDKVLISDFSYQFTRGEKLGIIGKNGAGKSTFIKILLGLIAPDNGSVDIGQSIKFGYFRQEGLDFDENARVIDIARSIAEVVTLGNGKVVTISQFLTQFLFEPEVQYDYVRKLSGGEKRRLYLLTILMQSPNFLILDEPTNDLDIMTLNILEDYLEQYEGCVIVVSHDRYFMDKVIDHLLIFEGEGKTRIFEGNYTQYRNDLEDRKAKEELLLKPKVLTTKTVRSSERAPKISYKEKKEYDELEIEIEALQNEKNNIENLLNSGNLTEAEIISKSSQYQEISITLDDKELRWLELADKM